jgi:tripartite ATP-independent transporter DctP family solute receptor
VLARVIFALSAFLREVWMRDSMRRRVAMTTQKAGWSILGWIVPVLLAVAWAAGPAKAADKIIIKAGHVLAPTEPTHLALLKWADRMKERTGGQVEMQVFASSQLGSNRDMMEQAVLGAAVISHADPGYIQDYYANFGVLNGPFLFREWDQAKRLVNGPLVKEMGRGDAEGKRDAAARPQLVLRAAAHHRPPADAHPEEMKGKKVRVPPNIMWKETIQAMGGAPTPLEWAEVYTGLAQKVVDAAEAPLSTLLGSRLYEVAKVITLTGHFKAITGMVIGEKFFQSLPPNVQKILEEEAVRAGDEMSAMTIAKQDEFMLALKEKGITFYQGDAAAFEKATQVVYTKFPAWTPGIYEKVKAALGS